MLLIGAIINVDYINCQFFILCFRIKALNDYDEKKSRREGALNALESAVIDTRNKIEDDDFVSFAKPEEADKINSKSREVCFFKTQFISNNKYHGTNLYLIFTYFLDRRLVRR